MEYIEGWKLDSSFTRGVNPRQEIKDSAGIAVITHYKERTVSDDP